MNSLTFFFTHNNYPEPWQISFQNPATEMMRGIIDLHHDILAFLILILIFVSLILLSIILLFNENKLKNQQALEVTGPLLAQQGDKKSLKAITQNLWQLFFFGKFGDKDQKNLFSARALDATKGTIHFVNTLKYHTKHNWTHKYYIGNCMDLSTDFHFIMYCNTILCIDLCFR